jgi:hypothetical protein
MIPKLKNPPVIGALVDIQFNELLTSENIKSLYVVVSEEFAKQSPT